MLLELFYFSPICLPFSSHMLLFMQNLFNYLPTPFLDDISSYQKLYQLPYDNSLLRVFGCYVTPISSQLIERNQIQDLCLASSLVSNHKKKDMSALICIPKPQKFQDMSFFMKIVFLTIIITNQNPFITPLPCYTLLSLHMMKILLCLLLIYTQTHPTQPHLTLPIIIPQFNLNFPLISLPNSHILL